MPNSELVVSDIIHIICLTLLFQVKGEVLFFKRNTCTRMDCISHPQKLCLDQTGSAICIKMKSSNIALAIRQIEPWWKRSQHNSLASVGVVALHPDLYMLLSLIACKCYRLSFF